MHYTYQGGALDMVNQHLFLFIIGILVLSLQQKLNAQEIRLKEIPHQDQEFPCISESQAQRYIQDFRVDIDSFGGKELCNANVDFKKLMNDLQIVEQGQFDNSKTENPLIKNFIKPNQYYSWMKSQTRGMNRGNDVPYATAYNSGGYFTMQDGWSLMTTLGRVGTVIHEARHTAGYSHTPCQQGPYKDSRLDACDTRYQYGGSHAIEMEYYAQVAVNGTNFHPAYQSMARLMALARANFVFNTPVIQAQQSLFAINDKHEGFLFHPVKKPTRLPQIEGQLKRTSYGVAIMNSQIVAAIDLTNDQANDVIYKDIYSYFKLLDFPVKISNSKDFLEVDINQKRYAVVLDENNQIKSYAFSRGQWGRSVQAPPQANRLSAYDPDGQNGVFLIGIQGEIWQFDPETQKITALKKTWDHQVIQVVRDSQSIYQLKNDGFIYKDQKMWDNDEQYFDMTLAPTYDAFEIVR